MADWQKQLEKITERAEVHQAIDELDDGDQVILIRVQNTSDRRQDYSFKSYGPITIAGATLAAFRFMLYLSSASPND